MPLTEAPDPSTGLLRSGSALSLFTLLPNGAPDLPVHLAIAVPTVPGTSPPAWLPPAARLSSGRLAGGRGLTLGQAAASALGEAAELLSASLWGDEPLLRRAGRDVADRSVPLAALALFAAAQTRNRRRWNRKHGAEEWRPAPVPDSRPIDWVEAASPDGGDRALVPAAYVYLGCHEAGDEAAPAVADSTGCAAGETREAAITAGFLEMVERDAAALWWHGRSPRPAADPREASVAAPIAAWLAARGRTMHLLDLTHDLGVPVRAAVSADREGGAVAVGLGAGFAAPAAATAALTEMVQVEVGTAARRAATMGVEAPRRPVTLKSAPHLRPAASPRSAARVAGPGGVEACLRVCREAGLRILVVDLTRAAVGVPAVRVIVPGLRPMRPRFAPGRLFDVPCVLGWGSRKTSAALEDRLLPG